ncbi:hypothetical protein VTO42DRAFT_5227 [Malbranchea cinnamomea]
MRKELPIASKSGVGYRSTSLITGARAKAHTIVAYVRGAKPGVAADDGIRKKRQIPNSAKRSSAMEEIVGESMAHQQVSDGVN